MKPANEAIAKLNRAIIVALGAVSFFLCPTISIGAIEYFVTDVGEIAGGQGSTDINSKGQVTGASYFVTLHGFIYDGKMRDIGTLGGSVSEGFSINDNGQITGESQLAGNSTRHAFLYDGTTMHDLGDLGGNFSEGFGINNSGHVVGFANPAGPAANHAFLYDGTMRDLGTLGGQNSYARSINDNGLITGYSLIQGNSAFHAFFYDGSMHDIGTLGGANSYGYGINDIGHVTGPSDTGKFDQFGTSIQHAFLYDGTMHDLGTISAGEQSQGLDINTFNVVVGFSTTSPRLSNEGGPLPHAFLYASDLGMIDLNTRIDPNSGWNLVQASAINDAGQITGYGFIRNERHAFVLTPVPEPSAFALLAIGAVGLCVHRMRPAAKLFPKLN